MYIDTATGNMDRIHEDKNYEENASLTLYTADGTLDFSNDHTVFKGRGNATWGYQKHPYTLILSTNGDLLDMGFAANWVLLANATDETNLNNKLILDLANRVGIQWSPDCRWVDLYLNGEYNGLYLLTEKVEVNNNRLNIGKNPNDFLCKIDLKNRWDILRNPFLTKAGRAVEISFPETLEKSKLNEIEQLVNHMEQEILSGADLLNSKTIDLDSWVRRYLIDEIAGNIDSDLASSYFYYHDGLFFAGPVWDYDMVLGNSERNQEPYSLIAKNKKKSATYLSPYYSALYSNESFYNRMVDIYRSEFVPVLNDWSKNTLDTYIDFISKASQSNSLRWRSMFDQLQSISQDTVHTHEDLREYLSKRIAFLNSAWLENAEYCTIQFESAPGHAYWNISIPKGSYIETSHVDIVGTVWVNAETGLVIDFGQPIIEDIILSKQITEKKASPLVTRDYITFLSIALLIIMFMGLLMVDIIQRHKERRAADEQKRTEVSP